MINLLLSFTGTYECALRGQIIDFIQVGRVTNSIIREAPVVRLQSRVNADCQERQFQELQCCVQLPYEVKWFQDETILPSSMYETSFDTSSIFHLDTSMKQLKRALTTFHSRDQHQQILLHQARLPVRKLQHIRTN